ncbi:M56 family metallopeptidase [Aminipila terrae]|uniref:Peptidase M56 domain-containing protein n=1 Tax=Aminipila terrae TaxID=2697030 RepID=A0A6P1MN46_9FIRM|nr:M56 family metallopeptidase [Aminipila terrae]QHI73518.1 hypothetical protein Ami3637_15045 [Aminipila terrae]
MDHNVMPVMDSMNTGFMASSSIGETAVNWHLVIMIVWAMGTIAIGLWLFYSNLKFSRKIAGKRTFLMSVETHYKENPDNKEKNLTNKRMTKKKKKKMCLPVYVVDGLYSPCLMKYRGETGIYVTSDLINQKEKLRYAINHELCHYRHHDLIWSMVRGIFLASYWFNPLVWVAAVMSKRDCELACDYGVIRVIGKDNRLDYGKALVDLISSQEQKNNVFQMATTMWGSSKGIKERVNMIVENKKMKIPTLIAILLIATLSVGFTFTEPLTNVKDFTDQQKMQITAFATKWADAVTERDARTIYGLCQNKELYLTIGGVAENGQLWMGVSSPWPWNRDYKINILDSSTIEIYYYFRTSIPTVYAAKEIVTIREIDGKYKAAQDSWKQFDKVESKKDFDEAYKFGFPELEDFTETYQFQADDNTDYNKGRKEILENPATAAIDQLNLAGARVSGIYKDAYAKKALVKFEWKDGEGTVYLTQPEFTTEKGNKKQATVWVVSNEKWGTKTNGSI